MQPDMTARIQIPKTARRGETIEVRVAIQHPMETGFRYDSMGKAIPKNVINMLVCRYGGVDIFRAQLGSGIAANPYIQFYMRVRETGTLEVNWEDDSGAKGSERTSLTVVA
jgi:sulfur-oxidizing protein SoxZ